MRRMFLIYLSFLFVFLKHEARASCEGEWLDPITEICWSCLFPITLGDFPIVPSDFKDSDNAKNPLCLCQKSPPPVPPLPGVVTGFWEPVRVIEVTRTPFCMVSLGGAELFEFDPREGGFHKGASGTSAFYHIHYYVYPLMAVFNIISDFACMSLGSLDIAYVSELDPSHDSSILSNFMHPESFLLANPIAELACTGDCISTSIRKKPTDFLFWCSGCQGSVYPFGGAVSHHTGGVATSSLLAMRQISKLHRLGMSKKTMTDVNVPNSPTLCYGGSYAPFIPKSQYRLQMTYPRANTTGPYSCNPLGMTDVMFSSFREYPIKGEDFVYMLWRKNSCCAL